MRAGAFATAFGAVLLGLSTTSVVVGVMLGAARIQPARPSAPMAAETLVADAPILASAAAVPTMAVREALPAPVVDERAPLDPGLVVYSGPRTADKVAITFDDGPSPTLTPRVLEVLREHDAHATFFLLGAQVEKFPELAQSIAADGHDLANHAHSHRSFRSLFPSQITGELDRTEAAIAEATGLHPRFVRPPFGRFPESTVPLVRDRGGDVVLWSVDAGDWADAAPAQIAEAVVRAARPGAIILLHDREPATVRALPQILAGLRRRDLEPVSVSELLGRPAYREPDAAASASSIAADASVAVAPARPLRLP